MTTIAALSAANPGTIVAFRPNRSMMCPAEIVTGIPTAATIAAKDMRDKDIRGRSLLSLVSNFASLH